MLAMLCNRAAIKCSEITVLIEKLQLMCRQQELLQPSRKYCAIRLGGPNKLLLMGSNMLTSVI